MKFYIGVTDDDGFHFLAQHQPEQNLDQPAADYLQWHQQMIYLG